MKWNKANPVRERVHHRAGEAHGGASSNVAVPWLEGGQSSAPASVVVVPSSTSDVQAATGDGVGEGAPPAPQTDFSHLTAHNIFFYSSQPPEHLFPTAYSLRPN